MAAQEDHADVVKLLLEHGANQHLATPVYSFSIPLPFTHSHSSATPV